MMAFQRFPINTRKRHSPVSTELRLRTLLADIEQYARDSQDSLGSQRSALAEVERLAASGREIR